MAKIKVLVLLLKRNHTVACVITGLLCQKIIFFELCSVPVLHFSTVKEESVLK